MTSRSKTTGRKGKRVALLCRQRTTTTDGPSGLNCGNQWWEKWTELQMARAEWHVCSGVWRKWVWLLCLLRLDGTLCSNISTMQTQHLQCFQLRLATGGNHIFTRLYLPKLLYVVRTYFHAHSTTNHNQNLHTRFLTALSQYYLILSGHFLVTSQTLLHPIMTFHGSLNNKQRALSRSL